MHNRDRTLAFKADAKSIENFNLAGDNLIKCEISIRKSLGGVKYIDTIKCIKVVLFLYRIKNLEHVFY